MLILWLECTVNIIKFYYFYFIQIIKTFKEKFYDNKIEFIITYCAVVF